MASQNSIAEKRSVQLTLTEEGQELVAAHKKAIGRFLNTNTGQTAQAISMQVKGSGMGGELQITHLARQRFLDMKSRNTARGKIFKKQFPIHNRILYGHFNTIVGRLKFGFTEDIKRTLSNIEN